MSTGTEPAKPGVRGRAVLAVLRGFVTVQAIAIFAQPVFAGTYLVGDYDMLAVHRLGADILTVVGLAQLVPAGLLWVRRGVRWPFGGSVLLVLGETGQYFAGLDGALDLHIPLGVTLASTAAIMVMAIWRTRIIGTPA